MRLTPLVLAACLGAGGAAAAPWRAARAQVGATTDLLTGTVRRPDGQPVADATVTVTSTDTRVARTRRTDARGRWVLAFPDGGGSYQVAVRAIGYAPQVLLVRRQVDEDQLVADVTLGAPPAAGGVARLDEVTARGRRTPRDAGRDRPTPGSTETVLTPDRLLRLPVLDPSDLAAIAALAPGVVAVGATDSTATQFSVAGQRLDQNNVTLDGLTYGAASVPPDAVRATRVVTSTWDVGRGQFSGGQVASTTRSGTNVLQGTLTDNLRSGALSFPVPGAGAFGQGYTQNTLSGGVGGPLVHDRLFAFVAGQLRGRDDPLQSLLSADAAALTRLGVSPDSAARFLTDVARAGGVATLPGIPDQRRTAADQLFARVDAVLSEGNTLMLRGDLRGTGVDATRVAALGLPSAGGDQRQTGGGVMAALTSQFATGAGAFVNEVRAYRSAGDNATTPYLEAPAARVQLQSQLPATLGAPGVPGAVPLGGTGVSVLQFGGNASLPQASRTRGFEGTEELSFLPAGSPHRVKLGVLVSDQDADQDATANRWGTYTFPSLAALEAGQASQFTRTLAPVTRTAGALNLAAWLGDVWRAGPGLQLTYGLRAEASRYAHAPARDAGLDSAFGLRTDRFPGETHVSPRLGFTWAPGAKANAAGGPAGSSPTSSPNGAGGDGGGRRGGGFGGGGLGGGSGAFGGGRQGGPGLVLRGGVGEFRGTVPQGLFGAAQAATGLPTAESQLVCVGPAVPPLDPAAWAADPAAIPAQCLSTRSDVPGTLDPLTGRPASRPNAVVLGPGFQAPRAWRAALGGTRRVGERTALSLDATYALGVAQYGFADANLRTTPAFTLPLEGNRPVYAPASAIVPGTGAMSIFASRVDPDYGRVLVATSGGRSDTRQLTAGVVTGTARGLQLQASYTFTRAVDQSTFPGAFGGMGVGATTAGDPNARVWAPSDLGRRHQLVGTVSWPARPWLELTGLARLASGAPFTPMVGSDINGDGARDDQAFVFDPARTADTAVANGMRRVLASAPASVRACLTRALGQVAGRNSCTGPWTPALDLQANVRPALWGLDRRLTLSVSTTNLLVGVDQLVHGSARMAGWGNPGRVDPTLLYVTGFDPAADAFRYQVNQRFGQSNAAANAYRAPFGLVLQARVAVGPDPARERLRQLFGGGAGGGRGADSAAAAARLARLPANPLDSLLARRDSLALTDAQAGALAALRDTLAGRLAAAGDSLRRRLAAARSAPDPRQAMQGVRSALAAGRAATAEALGRAQAVLGPEQWARVPERLRRPAAPAAPAARVGRAAPAAPAAHPVRQVAAVQRPGAAPRRPAVCPAWPVAGRVSHAGRRTLLSPSFMRCSFPPRRDAAAATAAVVAAAFAALALAPPGPLAAQPARPLTLAEALALAARNAPAVVEAEGQVRAGQAAVRAARGAFLPSFGLNATSTEQSPATPRLNPATGEIIGGRWATNGGFAANFTVFDAFQRQFDLRAARAQELSATAGVAQSRAGVGFDVKTQFFTALAADEALAAARVQRAQADTQLALTRARVLARTATVADSLQARIQVAQAELAEVTAANDRRAADAALGRLVGSLAPVTARADGGLPAPEAPLAVDSATLVALANAAPQVRQSALALDAARAGVRAARAPYYPTLALNWARNGLGSSNSFNPLPPNFRYTGQLRVSVNLPVFDQFTRQQALAQAQVAEATADAQARDARLSAAQTVAQQLAALGTARAQVAAQQVAITAGDEALRVQRQRYQLGVSTILDVLTAQTTLAQARFALAQARLAARTARAQLEALVDRDL